MSHKHPNADIRCNVSSCAYHCQNEDFCSLRSIQVEARRNRAGGRPEDESARAAATNRDNRAEGWRAGEFSGLPTSR